MAKISKKVSIKTVVGSVPKPKKGDAPKPIMRVLGHATATRSVTTQFGDSTGFKGTFEGINLVEGENYGVCVKGAEAWLPELITDMLVPVVNDSETGAQFAFDITVSHSERECGYEYSIEPLLAEENADPLSGLKAILPPLPKALAAPEAQAGGVSGDTDE